VIRTAHTADLDAAKLRTVRALLDEAFRGGFDDHDFEHALGGIHALAYEGEALVGHASVVQRRLFHEGRALRAGYVEAVGVRPSHQGRGHAGAMMAALERIVRSAYELGALSATEAGASVYTGRGWLRWEGPTFALTPAGIVRTAGEDGAIHVLPVAAGLDLTAALTCDWREGDVW
jgi:aminoglycoside 2'-N-acetyltransferase I